MAFLSLVLLLLLAQTHAVAVGNITGEYENEYGGNNDASGEYDFYGDQAQEDEYEYGGMFTPEGKGYGKTQLEYEYAPGFYDEGSEYDYFEYDNLDLGDDGEFAQNFMQNIEYEYGEEDGGYESFEELVEIEPSTRAFSLVQGMEKEKTASIFVKNVGTMSIEVDFVDAQSNDLEKKWLDVPMQSSLGPSERRAFDFTVHSVGLPPGHYNAAVQLLVDGEYTRHISITSQIVSELSTKTEEDIEAAIMQKSGSSVMMQGLGTIVVGSILVGCCYTLLCGVTSGTPSGKSTFYASVAKSETDVEMSSWKPTLSRTSTNV